jgi:hypothetical protein
MIDDTEWLYQGKTIGKSLPTSQEKGDHMKNQEILSVTGKYGMWSVRAIDEGFFTESSGGIKCSELFLCRRLP